MPTQMRLSELYAALAAAGATLREGNRLVLARQFRSQEERLAVQQAVTDWWPVVNHQWRGCLDEQHAPYWAATPDPLRPPTARFLCTRCHRDALVLVPLASIGGGDGTSALPYRPLPLPPGLPPLGAPVEIAEDDDDDESDVA